MSLNLTEAQIIQLAPDAASVKAGKGLAGKNKWVLLEYSDRAVWGHCQGSGKLPYQTVVDLKEIAFKCSCPSRKFPCKHGLGLLLLYAAHPEEFRQSDEPEWVASWLSKRVEKAEKREQKAKSETSGALVDEVAQAKRSAMRHQKIMNGLDDLEMWMNDLLRNGLINVPERAYNLFDGMARRMVDAQAPGLAGRLKAMQDIGFHRDEWKYELADRLGKLFLLIQGYKHLDMLSAEWKDEIRTQVGFPQSKEEVLAGEAVYDDWVVLHKMSQQVNDLNTDTYWLLGCRNKRYAIFLSFTPKGRVHEINLLPGSVYSGALYFYKGAGLLRRAVFKDFTLSGDVGHSKLSFCACLKDAASEYRNMVISNPFIENVPLLVENVHFALQGTKFCVQDKAGDIYPVSLLEDMRIDILAITGGKPFSAFFLADAGCWELKSIWYQSEYHTWRDERD